MSLTHFYLLCLYLLPQIPVVLHVCQIHTLLVIDVDIDLFDNFVASEVFLSEGDLLDLESLSKTVDHARVSELSFLLDVVQSHGSEWKTLLGVTLLACFCLKHEGVCNLRVVA